MNANDLRRLVERLTKTVVYLEALLEQADTLLVELELEREEVEKVEGNGRQTRHSIGKSRLANLGQKNELRRVTCTRNTFDPPAYHPQGFL